ncbi:MAG: SpoIIE family protein phosphatase [Eubacterium sp.]|nr:SpoIIE family protein phosphatase [Eubacterium sp.]
MKKEGKIAKRTISTILLVVFVLMGAISLSVGLQMKHILIERYSDVSISYVKSVADFVKGDTIKKYYTTGKKDAYYYEIENYLNATANATVNSDKAEGLSIKCLYVFVPNEDGFTYIWDAEPGVEPEELLTKYPYSEGAKEQIDKFLNKTVTEDIQYYTDGVDSTPMLTVSVPLYDSSGKVVAIIASDSEVSDINRALNKIIIGVLASIALIMIITMLVYYFATKKLIINPIVKLHEATDKIIDNIESDETVDIDIHTNDEIEMLANSFENMDIKLKEYIRKNEAITAEKERIGAELELATKIQADMLPNIYPAFPERNDFDIFATMNPAKEVGGDFYDFFLIDDSHLAMVIADVSGKGIPAALFMMMSKILIQNAVMGGDSPAEALEAVNRQICSNNREEMFVTVWLGIIDLKSGLLTAANAGHEKPIVKQPDGDFEVLNDRHGFVIGGLDGVKYRNYDIQLKEGAKLFLFTDGVVEATDESDELYGINRTLEILNSLKNERPKGILDGVKKSVDTFVGNAPQFDDLTMLCFEYREMTNEFTVDATVENVGVVVDYIAGKAENLPFTTKDKHHIEIAADEIMCNIANYAYENGTGKATVSVKADSEALIITVKDSGIPYNPLEKEDPDVTLPANERGIGGYGIYIVKKLMDSVTYEHKNGNNILTMKKLFKK